jgi:hypothetical protein
MTISLTSFKHICHMCCWGVLFVAELSYNLCPVLDILYTSASIYLCVTNDYNYNAITHSVHFLSLDTITARKSGTILVEHPSVKRSAPVKLIYEKRTYPPAFVELGISGRELLYSFIGRLQINSGSTPISRLRVSEKKLAYKGKLYSSNSTSRPLI